MFKMIGGDGREYGPVTAEQLREWIADHRANGQTRIQAEGESAWKPLSDMSEFSDALAAAAQEQEASNPPPSISSTFAEPVPVQPRLDQATGDLQVFDCVGRGWLLLQQNFFMIAGGCLVAWAAQTLPQFLGCLGFGVSVVISGPIFGGLCVMVLKLARGQPAAMGDLRSCFGGRFLACMLVYMVCGLLEQLGLALCLLPGVFLSTVWLFSLPLAADRGLDFVPAVAASWRAVMPRFFSVLGVLALAFLPMVVFSIYSTIMMMSHMLSLVGSAGAFSPAMVWENREQLAQFGARLGLEQQMVLLLNLPFAWATLMTAYEDLFGGRRAPTA